MCAWLCWKGALVVVVVGADDERHHLCSPAAVRMTSQVRPPVLLSVGSAIYIRDFVFVAPTFPLIAAAGAC